MTKPSTKPEKVWEYDVIQADALVGLLNARARVRETGDGYVSRDSSTEKLDSLLKQGFRWVRTEGGFAVFER